jgi:hypothetical protein
MLPFLLECPFFRRSGEGWCYAFWRACTSKKGITPEPNNSVLLLADFSNAQIDPDALEHVKLVAVFDRPHLKRSAWVFRALTAHFSNPGPSPELPGWGRRGGDAGIGSSGITPIARVNSLHASNSPPPRWSAAYRFHTTPQLPRANK